MNGGLEKLERQLAADMSLLRDLPDLRPSPAALARLNAAVIAEAGRRTISLRPWRSLRSAVGVAAACLLALGWNLSRDRAASTDSATDAAILNDWVDAADETGRAVTMLINEDWPYADDAGDPANEDAELDDLFRSFDDLQNIGA